jgi:heme/copper-type cytochrome/quinol oxidase subunit 3
MGLESCELYVPTSEHKTHVLIGLVVASLIFPRNGPRRSVGQSELDATSTLD